MNEYTLVSAAIANTVAKIPESNVTYAPILGEA